MGLKLRLMAGVCILGLGLASGAARADVVAVVSVRNPVTALSKVQVIDIFLGRTNRFPDGSQAVPVDQPDGSPARNEFYASFGRTTAAQLRAYWSKIIFTGRGQPPKTVANAEAIRKLLAANPQVIAYVERVAVDESMKVLGMP